MRKIFNRNLRGLIVLIIYLLIINQFLSSDFFGLLPLEKKEADLVIRETKNQLLKHVLKSGKQTVSEKIKAENSSAEQEINRVKRVIDGDTIVLSNGEKLRYIGIDTPERGECGYEQAKERNKQLVTGQTVWLEKDKNNRDRYQRLLRYVYIDAANYSEFSRFSNFSRKRDTGGLSSIQFDLADFDFSKNNKNDKQPKGDKQARGKQLMVNLILVEEGWARAKSYPPDTKYQHLLFAAQERARKAKRGLWQICWGDDKK